MKPKAERIHVQAVLEKAALEKQLRLLKKVVISSSRRIVSLLLKVAVNFEEKKPEPAQNVNVNLGERTLLGGERFTWLHCSTCGCGVGQDEEYERLLFQRLGIRRLAMREAGGKPCFRYPMLSYCEEDGQLPVTREQHNHICRTSKSNPGSVPHELTPDEVLYHKFCSVQQRISAALPRRIVAVRCAIIANLFVWITCTLQSVDT
eukprot:752857-Hanusia_phi.AAC.4